MSVYDQDFYKPILRRRDVVAITGLERGLIAGWEERGLWKYEGPQVKHRFYRICDAILFAIAGELIRHGVKAQTAWEILNVQAEEICSKVETQPGRFAGGYLLYVLSEGCRAIAGPGAILAAVNGSNVTTFLNAGHIRDGVLLRADALLNRLTPEQREALTGGEKGDPE